MQVYWWGQLAGCNWRGRTQAFSRLAGNTFKIQTFTKYQRCPIFLCVTFYSLCYYCIHNNSYVTSANGVRLFGQQLGMFTSWRAAQNFFSSNTPFPQENRKPWYMWCLQNANKVFYIVKKITRRWIWTDRLLHVAISNGNIHLNISLTSFFSDQTWSMSIVQEANLSSHSWVSNG